MVWALEDGTGLLVVVVAVVVVVVVVVASVVVLTLMKVGRRVVRGRRVVLLCED